MPPKPARPAIGIGDWGCVAKRWSRAARNSASPSDDRYIRATAARKSASSSASIAPAYGAPTNRTGGTLRVFTGREERRYGPVAGRDEEFVAFYAARAEHLRR